MAQSKMLARAKERGMHAPTDDDTWEKEFLAKILVETVNRFIFTVVHKELKAQD